MRCDGFYMMDLPDYRAVLWGGAVRALAADGWLPDDTTALRRATNAWRQPGGFRAMLRDAGMLAMHDAWGGSSYRLTRRMIEAAPAALAPTVVAAGAQQALDAWWSGTTDGEMMAEVVAAVLPEHRQGEIAEGLIRRLIPVDECAAFREKRTNNARNAGFATYDVMMWMLKQQWNSTLWRAAGAAVAPVLRELVPCPTIEQMLR